MTNAACHTDAGRTILHVDMDAYYASVEQRDNPSLRSRPVIVGGSAEGRGVVSAASYEARRDGVHSAMPMITARRRCPAAVILPTRMSHYAAISHQIREIFLRFTPLVEPLALDEAFLDLTPSRRLFGSAADIGRQIKEAIASELRLVASVGVAPNKFVAKIASDLEKPAGFVTVAATDVRWFLDPLPIERMWGVGRVGARSFHQLGVKTFADLRRYPADALRSRFGRLGEHFRLLAEGIDHRPVVVDREAKSISHEKTFAHDISDPELLRSWLMELTEQVARRIRRHELVCGRVFIKVRWSDFRTMTRARKLQTTTNTTMQLWRTAVSLLEENLPLPCQPVRLLGMGVDQLGAADPRQLLLFDREDQDKECRLDAALDGLKDRLGADAVRRGNVVSRRQRGRS